MTISVAPQRGHRQRAALTSLRTYRLVRMVSIAEVSVRSGLNTYRISVIERRPELARPEEIAAHKKAIDDLFSEQESARGVAS